MFPSDPYGAQTASWVCIYIVYDGLEIVPPSLASQVQRFSQNIIVHHSYGYQTAPITLHTPLQHNNTRQSSNPQTRTPNQNVQRFQTPRQYVSPATLHLKQTSSSPSNHPSIHPSIQNKQTTPLRPSKLTHPQPKETTGTSSPKNTKNSVPAPAPPPSKSSSSAQTPAILSQKPPLSSMTAADRDRLLLGL